MAAWITVYCKRSLAGAIPDQIQRCVSEADWSTLAEGYGIEDEKTVRAALNHLRIESQDDRRGEAHCIYYRRDRPKGCRQIECERWAEPAMVKQEVAQALVSLRGKRGGGVKRIREHLHKVIETVAFELGWDQLEGVAVVLTYEMARCLAYYARGLIEDHEDQWWTLTRRGHYRQVLAP
jgi:hypothetical protein